jgi:predicted methyltransferase
LDTKFFGFFSARGRHARITGVERYVLRGGRWGYDRLQLLARVRRAHTLELLGLAGLRPGMRCVDLGCGGGEGTFELAELAGPGGFVVGVDMDEGKNLAPSTPQAIADAITGAGLATETEVAAAFADLAAFAADPQTVIGGPRIFQLWARRP